MARWAADIAATAAEGPAELTTAAAIAAAAAAATAVGGGAGGCATGFPLFAEEAEESVLFAIEVKGIEARVRSPTE